VWHASAASVGFFGGPAVWREAASLALNDVGDASLGEWHEQNPRAYHIRRRLSAEEAPLVGPVVDVRGTPEARYRLERVRKYVPPVLVRSGIWLSEWGQD
jgi:hypothetical protein